ncbi:MAG: PorP/SprF family type IX secretion system membrane protein [Bacteroidales bacterium]
MRKIVVILLLMAVNLHQHAQDQHYSGFLPTLVYTNPSCISAADGMQFGATYRNQWPGLNNVFSTYSAAFIMPVENLNSSFGLSLVHDNQGQGSLLKSSLNGIYAYTIGVSDNIDVSAGLGLSYVFRSVSGNNLIFESDLTGAPAITEPLNYDHFRSGYGDFSLGFSVYFKDIFFSGVSVNHITRPDEHQGASGLNSLARRYSLYAGGMVNMSPGRNSRDIFLLPGIIVQQQQHYLELYYGANCRIDPIIFGLWARQDLNFHFDAIVLNTGFTWQQYNIYYSYDVNVQSMKFFSAGMGAHEVTFLINFQYNVKRNKRGAIKCPKI